MGRFGQNALSGWTHRGSREREPLAEFRVSAGGEFTWRRRRLGVLDYEMRTGVISDEALRTLLEEARAAPTGPITDDAGTVMFGWLDGNGRGHSQTFYMVGDPPNGESLLVSIELLTRAGPQAAVP